MMKIACTICGEEYPAQGAPFRCSCGGMYDVVDFPPYSPANLQADEQRHNPLFGPGVGKGKITLGEGNTPLLKTSFTDGDLFLKMENQNPTGSYKDRGSAELINFLRSRGVTFAVEDSSGNAGASFAGYCARAGIQARVFVPESASGPKCMQIEAYGAELVRVPGPRSEAAKAVLTAAEAGSVYASHAWMPFGLVGIAAIAYEIVEQLGSVPGSVIAPVGHGGLLYGIMRGFESMLRAGTIQQEPQYIGVQAANCAPLVDAYQRGSVETVEPSIQETAAEGVKVTKPARGKAILQRMLTGKGRMIAIDESDLLSAYWESAGKGFFMEPTSALVWAAAKTGLQDFKTPVVAVITGSGYKSSIQKSKE